MYASPEYNLFGSTAASPTGQLTDNTLQSTGFESSSFSSSKEGGAVSRLRGVLLIATSSLVLIGLVGVTTFVIVGTGREMPDDEVVDVKTVADDDLESKPTVSPEPPRTRTTFRQRAPPPPPPPATRYVPPSDQLQFSVTELVCTVGAFAIFPYVLGPDGLCTYIFYCDVLIVDGVLYALETNASLEAFKEGMQERTMTEGGISFDSRYVNPEHLDNLKLQAELSTLSQQNVKHYGILNMITDASHIASYVNKAKLIIDRLKDLQGHDPARKMVIALGLSNYSQPDAFDIYSSQFKAAVERTKADTVIALSSVGSPPHGSACIAVPPALFDPERLPDAAEEQSKTYPNLKKHATLVAADVQYSRPNVKVGLSFEMGTLVYAFYTEPETLEEAMYAKCKNSYVTNADIVDCKTMGATEQIAGVFVGTVVKDQNVIYLWDEEASFLSKLNDLNGVINRRTGMSWLLHNIHLGDYSDDCKRGPFDKVQWIKKRFGIP